MIEFQNCKLHIQKAKRQFYIEKLCIPQSQSCAIIGGSVTERRHFLDLFTGKTFPKVGSLIVRGRCSWDHKSLRYEETMTIGQNIRFFARLAGFQDIDSIPEKMDALALSNFSFNRAAKILSPEDKAEISLCLTLLMPFDIFIFDGLPYIASEEKRAHYLSKIQSMRSEKQFVFSVKDFRHVQEYVDCAVVLHENGMDFTQDLDAIQDN